MRKFWEDLGYGRVTNLVAYADDPANLPDAVAGAVWRENEKFDERTAAADEPDLARIFERARQQGYATVKRLV